MTDQDAIRAVCARLGKAHASRDADGIVDCYADDVLVYGLAPPLSERGQNRRDVADWLATWSTPIVMDAAGVEVTVSSDVAWTTALNRMRGMKTDGTKIDIWFRSTLCFAKRQGNWKIVHDHSSTPFYMDGSFRAAVDLKP